MLNGAWKKYTVRNETPNYKLPTRSINKFEISLRGNVNSVACFQSIFIAMKIFYVCNSFFTVCPQQRHNGSSPTNNTLKLFALCLWLASWLAAGKASSANKQWATAGENGKMGPRRAGSWELGADASETSWALRALSLLDVFSCFTLLGQFGDNAAYACRVYCLRCLCRCQVPSV